MKTATLFLFFSLALICWTETTVAAPPADTPPNKSMEEFRNHLRSTLTNYLITQTGARFGKRMAPSSSPSAFVNRALSAQNPAAAEWDEPLFGGVSMTSSGVSNGVMDICFKVSATPEIQNLLLS